MARSDVSFASGGVDCAAWLYRPDERGPLPLVVIAHGAGGTREEMGLLDRYAERFLAAGLGALAFDYRHFGASAGEPRQLLDIAKQKADYHAAVRYARALDWVDPDRVALWGTSLSGGHVLAVAAKDPRIAAVVSQCPFTDGLAFSPAWGLANIVKVMLAGLRDQLGALVGRPPHCLPLGGPPGSLALMPTPDWEATLQAVVPVETRWENRVAARIVLRGASYRPGRSVARVRCPVLFCVCEDDALAPAEATLKFARAARRGEIKRYPIGHFEIYLGEWWERAVADQTEFLVRRLCGGRQHFETENATARS